MITLNSKFPAPFAPDETFALAWAGTGVIPWIKSEGVMEISNILDFHSGSGVAGEDYAVRLKAFTYLENSYGKLEIEGALTVDSDFQFLGNFKVGTVNVTPTQVSFLAGCTSNVQTQLNSKAAASYVDSQVAGKASTSYVDTAVSTCLRASGGGYTVALPCEFSANTFFTGPVFTDGVLSIRNGANLSSNVVVGVTSVTPTQVSFLSGSTSNIQTQLDSKIGNSTTDLTVSGTFANPGRSYIYCTLTNTQTLANGTSAAILFNNVTNYGSNINYNSTNGRFTAVVTGLYRLESTCRLSTYGSGTRTVGFLAKNGVNIIEVNQVNSCCISLTVYLAAGDYAQVIAYNATGASSNIGTGLVTTATCTYLG